jgi:hypothetical protein
MQVLTLSQNKKGEDVSLTRSQVPLFLPPSSSLMNQTIHKKASTFSIRRCGKKVPHCTSSLIAVARRTSSQWRSSSGWTYRKCCTRIPTPLDGSAKEAISVSSNSVNCHMASIPSKTRYCVMFLLLKFVMFFWANLIYGNAMLYMSLGLVVLLLLRTRNCTGSPLSSISLISAKQCKKVISQTGKFVFFVILSESKRKIVATSRAFVTDLSTQ